MYNYILKFQASDDTISIFSSKLKAVLQIRKMVREQNSIRDRVNQKPLAIDHIFNGRFITSFLIWDAHNEHYIKLELKKLRLDYLPWLPDLE